MAFPRFALACIQIRETTTAGRAVFTNAQIPAGTNLLIADDLAIHTIHREYIREICAYCFAYAYGRRWKLRDDLLNVCWCSDACKTAWRIDKSADALDAIAAIEALIANTKGIKTDTIMLEANEKPPDNEVAVKAWASAEEKGAAILRLRSLNGKDEATIALSKADRKFHQLALTQPARPAILLHLLSAVLCAASSPHWNKLMTLVPSSKPYAYAQVLAHHLTSYHYLLCILPPNLLPSCTPTALHAAVSRDAANSFGIRSLEDDGSEMFGYGVWPSASFWNHSCEPNVGKRRVGREWVFETRRDIAKDEELCITYLGGEEDVLGVVERRERLKVTWGFVCQCVKCARQDGR